MWNVFSLVIKWIEDECLFINKELSFNECIIDFGVFIIG